MTRLRQSLVGKLFVAMAMLSFVIVALMAVFIAENMRSGFSSYLLEIELEQFDDLSQALATQYNRDGQNWIAFDGNPRRWHDIVRSNIERPVRPEGERTGRPRPPKPPQGAHTPPPRESGLRRPPPPSRGDPRQLGRRLSLLDASKKHVAGAELRSDDFVTRAILSNDETPQTIGYLALLQSRAGTAGRDRAFLWEQLKALALASSLALSIAALAAWGLARYFLKPIQGLMQGADRLATGESGVHLQSNRKDEIGVLVARFNEMAQSLERAKQAERQWVSDASHELKTPLAVLQGKIEGLQDGIYQPNKAFLSDLHASIMRLSQLVNDLNSLAQSGEAKLSCDWSSDDLAEIISDALERQSNRLAKAGLEVELHLPKEAPLICDRGRLAQLLDNLIENSRRYTLAPGRVAISLSESSYGYVLVISDTEPCPTLEQLPKLFERFYRTETSRNRQWGGSGLGLPICRAIVEAHGGKIKAGASDLGGLQIQVILPGRKMNEQEN